MLDQNDAVFDPNYTISSATDSSARENYASHRKTGERESGESTPPLWRTSPPRRRNRYRSLSPASKAQAIARGQRELMEMVRTMPEGCFELSLRDMVEKPWERSADLSQIRQENLDLDPKEEIAMKTRSGSVEAERGGGFRMKMVFPVPAKSKRKNNSAKNEDKDWWKRKIPILEDTDIARSTTTTTAAAAKSSRPSNIASTTTRRGGWILSRCCFFFRPKKRERSQHTNGLQEL